MTAQPDPSLREKVALTLGGLLLGSCTVQPAAPAPEPEFEIVAVTYREGFASNPRTAALVRETATGCLYSVAEGKGATPLILPDGKHAGCRTKEAGHG